MSASDLQTFCKQMHHIPTLTLTSDAHPSSLLRRRHIGYLDIALEQKAEASVEVLPGAIDGDESNVSASGFANILQKMHDVPTLTPDAHGGVGSKEEEKDMVTPASGRRRVWGCGWCRGGGGRRGGIGGKGEGMGQGRGGGLGGVGSGGKEEDVAALAAAWRQMVW